MSSATRSTLKIEKITVADKTDLRPADRHSAIESTADIAGTVLHIGAKTHPLHQRGFASMAPNRMAISFPEGMTIPASPLRNLSHRRRPRGHDGDRDRQYYAGPNARPRTC